jgi:transcriptional regulator of arginine metabolism
VRIPNGSAGYKYSVPAGIGISNIPKVNLNIVPVIQDIIDANGFLVIKTIPGNASNTAFFIDSAGRYEIAGTIAGDDTILLIPRDGITIPQVHTCLEIVLPGVHNQIKK